MDPPFTQRVVEPRVLRALHEIAVAIGGVLDPVALAQLVVDQARDLVGADLAHLYFYEPRADRLVSMASTLHGSGDLDPPIVPGEGVAGQAFQRREPVVVHDYSRWQHARSYALGHGVQAAAAAPLLVADRAVGVITVGFRTCRAAVDEQANVLSLLAAQVGPALEVVRLYRDAQQSEREARVLYEALRAMGGTLELQPRLERLLDAAAHLTEADMAEVELVDPARAEVELVAANGDNRRALGLRTPLERGLSGVIVREQRPVRTSNMPDDPRTWAPDLVREEGIRSWLGVPLADEERVFGVLAVASRQEDVFTEEHERRLASLAGLAAAAVREARLYAQAQWNLERRAALLRVSRRLAAESDPSQVMRAVLEEAVVLVGGSSGAIFRWDEAQRALVRVWDTRPTPPPSRSIRLGDGASGQAAARRRPVLTNDSQHEPWRFAPAGTTDVRAVAAVPLLDSSRLLGVLTVVALDPHQRFTPEDGETLELLAASAAAKLAGLERTRLHAITLAGRELAHRLNNDLALAVGTLDLLREEPAVPAALRNMVCDAAEGLAAAVRAIAQFQGLARFETKETPLGPALDIERSTQPAELS